jgi:hypothetical protein
MFETLKHLLDFKGAGAKAVVWPHNSHIGDAAFTEMGLVREEINIGQLLTESKPLHERLLAPAPAICPRSRRVIARWRRVVDALDVGILDDTRGHLGAVMMALGFCKADRHTTQ